LNNLIFKVVKSDKISEIYGYHTIDSDVIKVSEIRCPHIMHNLVQYLKCDFTILESSGTSQGVKALQPFFMVISGPRNSGKIPELS